MVLKKIIISDEIEELVGDCVVKSLNMHTELEEKAQEEPVKLEDQIHPQTGEQL